MKWFDRTFAFDQPGWMYPNIVERIRGTPARLEDLVSDIPATVLTRQVDEAWSAQQHAGHLLDLEPLWMGRLDDLLAHEPRLRAADLANQRTYEAHHNVHPIQDVLHSFRAIRMQFVHRLDDLGVQAETLTALHPRLEQPMRLIDLLFFVAEHDDHHLAHITRLKRHFGVHP